MTFIVVFRLLRTCRCGLRQFCKRFFWKMRVSIRNSNSLHRRIRTFIIPIVHEVDSRRTTGEGGNMKIYFLSFAIRARWSIQLDPVTVLLNVENNIASSQRVARSRFTSTAQVGIPPRVIFDSRTNSHAYLTLCLTESFYVASEQVCILRGVSKIF